MLIIVDHKKRSIHFYKSLFLIVLSYFSIVLFLPGCVGNNRPNKLTIEYALSGNSFASGEIIFVSAVVDGEESKKDSSNTIGGALFNSLKVQLLTSEQQIVSFIRQTPRRAIAVISLPLQLNAGNYTVAISNAVELVESFPVTLYQVPEKRETIYMNSQMDKITRQDNSQKKFESAELSKILTTVNDFDPYSPLFKGEFLYPLPESPFRVTSRFGEIRDFKRGGTLQFTAVHKGLDFGVPTGERVVSAAAGKVVLAKKRIVTGNSIIIEHLPGLYTLYYHLDEIHVILNQYLTEGSTIGTVGSTGMATGSHLHFEIRYHAHFLRPPFYDKKHQKKVVE